MSKKPDARWRHECEKHIWRHRRRSNEFTVILPVTYRSFIIPVPTGGSTYPAGACHFGTLLQRWKNHWTHFLLTRIDPWLPCASFAR
jgi:hypothetical protein